MGVAQSGDHSWLGWFALLPLFHSIRVLSTTGAFGAGAIWGFSTFVFGAFGSHSHVSPFLTCALSTLVPAVYCALGCRLTRRIGFSPYLLALGWMGVEFAFRPLGSHNGLLAGTQGDHEFIVSVIGAFAGYVLVAFLVAFFNATLLAALSEVRVHAGGGRIATTSSRPQQGIFASEILTYPSYLVNPSQPRAPPALAFAGA